MSGVFFGLYAQNSVITNYDFEQYKGNIIKFNPTIPILWGPIPLTSEYRLIYETPLSMKNSLQVGASYLGKSPLFLLINDTLTSGIKQKLKYNGFRFQFALKHYLNKNKIAPNGSYVAFMASYSTAKLTTEYLNIYQTYLRANYINLNIILGYQLFILDALAIDIFSGLGYKNNTWITYQTGTPITIEPDPFEILPFNVVLGMNFGFVY